MGNGEVSILRVSPSCKGVEVVSGVPFEDDLASIIELVCLVATRFDATFPELVFDMDEYTVDLDTKCIKACSGVV
jgi:hypothetical protein